MSPERRRWLIGGGVAAVLALAVWMQMSASTPPPAGRTTPVRPRAAAKRAPAPEVLAPVRLEALQLTRDEPTDAAQRNPFRFKPKVAPPPPRSAASVPVPVEAPPAPAGPVTPPGPPPPPPIALKFIGLVEKADGMKVAVLTDGKVTMYGREGDIIDGRYRIVKIGVESVEVTHADGRGRQTIRLTGQ